MNTGIEEVIYSPVRRKIPLELLLDDVRGMYEDGYYLTPSPNSIVRLSLEEALEETCKRWEILDLYDA